MREVVLVQGVRARRGREHLSTREALGVHEPCPSSADSTPPSSPTGLAASAVTQTGFVLGWTASSDDSGVAGYDVYRDGNKVASPTATSVIQSGLACGKSYALEVSARDAAGNASPRALLTVSTGACTTPPADTTPPSTPSGLGVSGATRTSVLLGWNASIDNSGVAGYRVYVNGTYTTTATQLSATMLRLSCGTAYTFGVEAVDAAGNASVRASVTGSTTACPDIAAPTAPTNLVTTSRTATSVALSWSASSDDVGVTGYGLYRGGSSTGSSSTTTGIFSGLACGTNYTLAVDANDAAGNRSPQTVVMVSTTACPDTTAPSAPTALSASSVTQTSLVLNWIGSSDNVSVSSYDVYEDGAKVASVSSTSSAQSGLACGTSYAFGVVARDAAGNSSATTSMNASTAACPAPTWTSSIADGAAVQTGTTWTVSVSPNPDSVEFWATPVGGPSNKLKTDTSAPYDVVLNLAPGNYILGVCAVHGTVRTCFDDRKNVTVVGDLVRRLRPRRPGRALLRRGLPERHVRSAVDVALQPRARPDASISRSGQRPEPATAASRSCRHQAGRGTPLASSYATPIPAGRTSPDCRSRRHARTPSRPSTSRASVSETCGGSRRGSTCPTTRARSSSGRTAGATRSRHPRTCIRIEHGWRAFSVERGI